MENAFSLDRWWNKCVLFLFNCCVSFMKGLGDAQRIDEAFQVLESVEQGTAVGSPQLSAALFSGLLNALIESG